MSKDEAVNEIHEHRLHYDSSFFMELIIVFWRSSFNVVIKQSQTAVLLSDNKRTVHINMYL